MQVTEDGAASNTEQLAHARPAVERWLSWSGLVPLPAFLLLHLSRELQWAFANDVSDVLRPAPGALAVATSWLLVWLPLGVHAALGVYFLVSGRQLSTLAGAGGDVPRLSRLVSRVSSALALLFVLYHARTYAFSVWLGDADARDAGFRLLAELSSTRFGVPVLSGAYLLGLLATVAHAGLAVHRALAAEGLLATAARRRTSARACAAFGALLFGVGAAAVIRVASGVLLR
jgi:succinate dehydrogenase/fumarate reductase cytochrome b subunit